MLTPYLHESFAGPSLHPQLRWHCEPSRWSIDQVGRFLRIEPDVATDFWQTTHYGFQVDNGHYLHTELSGDFVVTAQVAFRPVHQYDQAGIMVRVSSSCWLKSSVEYEPFGPSRLGAVVTNLGYSDWSTQSFTPSVGSIWLRARRESDDYIIEWSQDGQLWEQLRVAHLHEGRAKPVSCGLYACSPKGVGFQADFKLLQVDAGRLS